jgi:hypothetical protein
MTNIVAGMIGLVMLLLPVSLQAQQSEHEARLSALATISEHVDSIVTRIAREEVPAHQMRIASELAPDALPLAQGSSMLGMQVRRMEDAVHCHEGALTCESIDGSRAGFVITEADFDHRSAVVVVTTWVLEEYRGDTFLYGQADRVFLTRSDGGWRIDRVQTIWET